MRIALALLGPMDVTWAGEAIVLGSATTRALVAYLALEADRPQTRERLAALLWPDRAQSAAFNNLRQALARARQALPEPAYAAMLEVTQHTLRFKSDGAIVDVAHFEELLALCATHVHAAGELCPACVERMEQAAALYRGDLLQGLFLEGSQPWQEWLFFKRETLHRQALDVFDTLTRAAETAADYRAMRRHAQRQIALEPWREAAHWQMMRALAYGGERAAALAAYETCRRVLDQELGIVPSPELTALYQRIKAGQSLTRSQPLDPMDGAEARPRSPQHAWSEVPEIGPLFGRGSDIARLQTWLGTDRCRLVAVLGIGGVGKTALAATVVKAVADQFDIVIWRSVLNAPPFEEWLRPVLQFLTGHTLGNLPAGLDDQLALLLDALRQQRCLLVLDNLESLLQADGHGQMRAGYDGYTHLLERLAHSQHRSCVLLTSRERPQGLARWEADLPWVRTLRLEGLDVAGGQAILAARGLTGQAVDAHALVTRYSGHPLALKLVAQTVHELFGGSIADFLCEEPLIFDDIRAVLDQQFARLAPLEQEIMTWLAIEREPLTLPALRADLLQPGAPREVVKALSALQRRSLLEPAASALGAAPAGASFTLQNVIMEYVTDRLVEDAWQEIAGGRLDCLHRYALLKAQAKEYVRQSQARLILQPVVTQVLANLGETGLVEQVRRLLAALRVAPPAPGYAAGNLLNLVLHAGVAPAGYDFSHLCVWQADLRGVALATLNLAHADLSTSAFTVAFDVDAMKFDEAGQLLVAGIVEGNICVWRAAAGQLHHGFRSPAISLANGFRTVVFSHDGQFLACGSQDFAVGLWSVANGDHWHTLPGHTNDLLTLTFSADGRRLASSSRDGTVRVWDVPSGQLLHILYEHADAISALAFSPDGALLAGGGSEQIICLWDAHVGQVTATLSGHTREIECLAFSADGRLLASGAHDGTICLWDVTAGQHLRTLPGHSQIVRSIVLHPDGQQLASGGADRLVRLWDLRTGQALHILSGHAQEVTSVDFSPDGQVLVSASVDQTVKLWDTRTGYVLDTITGHTDMVRSIRFSPDGRRLVSGSADGLVRLWDMRACAADVATRGQIVGYLQGHAGEIRSVAFSPDGRLVASGGVDQTVRVWEVATGRVVRTLPGHTSMVKALAFSPDGRVLASGGADRLIHLWPAAEAISGQHERVLRGHEDEINSLVFSPDGRTLLSSSLDHTARLWALDGDQELRVLRGPSGTLAWAVFTPDGQLVVATDYLYTVYVWEVGSGQRRERWDGPTVASLCVFSPDGETLASVAPDQAIEIRHAHTFALRHRLYGHSAQVLSLDFSPTEPILASSSWDGTIRLWDLRTGASLTTLHAPGPYAGIHITGVTGITEAQRVALRALGAVDES